MIGVALLAVAATFSPAQPTVGDRIVLRFNQYPVVLNRDAEFEIVQQDRSRIIIRTFQPKPLALSGYAGGEEFHGLTIPVRSVLLPNDDLKPAPLVPPRGQSEPVLPFILIAVAALVCAAAWIVLWLLERRAQRALIVAPPFPPHALFRQRVMALRAAPSWARLADALRDYLAATSDLSLDLTTTQLLARTSDPVVARILRQGDLEKFSPWGAAAMNFDEVIERALALAPEIEEEEAA